VACGIAYSILNVIKVQDLRRKKYQDIEGTFRVFGWWPKFSDKKDFPES
jgi:hypothetical protein